MIALAVTAALVRAPAAWAVTPVNVYRFYNMRNGSHFYTASEAERTQVWTTLSSVYKYEGVTWTLDSSSIYGRQALHRFYNVSNGTHFYTASESERSYVQAYLSGTYRYEGVAYYVSASSVPGSLAVHRFYYRPLGSHFYTADVAERDRLIAYHSSTYTYEGPAFFVPSAPRTGYDYAAACSYADKWSSNTAKPRNPAYDTRIDNDCCNFVSQCLHDTYAGKKAFDTSGPTEAFQWWTRKTVFGWDSTMSWVNCGYFYNYLMENPAGVYLATWDWNPATSFPEPPSYTVQGFLGDILFYDWEGNGGKDHVGIRTGAGLDANAGVSGDLTDQHNSDRKKCIWHLQPYNEYWRSTRITMVRPL